MMLHPIPEEQLPSDMCTYWPANPTFDPKRVLLRRMFFINEEKKSTCLSASILHAIINPWWNSAPFGGEGPSPSFSPTKKSLRWWTVCPLYVTPCVSAWTVSSSARVATFVCTPPRGTGRPGCLWARNTQPDMDYLLRVFPILQQVARLYYDLARLLSHVTLSLASTSFVEPQDNASTNIDYPHLYEELVTFF